MIRRRFSVGVRALVVPLVILVLFAIADLIDLLLPYDGAESSTIGYVLVHMLYLAVLLVVSVVFVGGFEAAGSWRRGFARKGDEREISRVAAKILIFSLIGLGLIAIDRIFIQGVNYSHGINEARSHWRELAAERGGVSSPLSVIGNLAYPMVFPLLSFILAWYESVRWRKLLLLTGLGVVLLYAILVGGRVSVLLAMAFMMAGCLVRVIRGGSLIPRSILAPSLIGGVGAFFYISWIFVVRINGSGVAPDMYVASLAGRLGAVNIDAVTIGSESPWMAALYAAGIYVAHVGWILRDLVAGESVVHGAVVGYQVANILSTRANIEMWWMSSLADWTFKGSWISAPGAFFHDFGFIGVLVGGGLAGLLLAFAIILVANPLKKKRAWTDDLLGVVLISGLLLSPLTLAIEVVEYIYASAMVFFLWLWGKVLLRKTRSKEREKYFNTMGEAS